LKRRALCKLRGSPRSILGTAGGFSLLELIVVLVLISLLFTIIGISISRSISGAEMRNAARELTAGLRHTRGQAIIQRQQQVFTVDAERRTWQAGANSEPIELPEGLGITLNTARSELTGERAGGIRFYPDGASTGGSVVLSTEGREWHIPVGWLTGEIGIDRDPQR
jgi:general secretion pathway protein H